MKNLNSFSMPCLGCNAPVSKAPVSASVPAKGINSILRFCIVWFESFSAFILMLPKPLSIAAVPVWIFSGEGTIFIKEPEADPELESSSAVIACIAELSCSAIACSSIICIAFWGRKNCLAISFCMFPFSRKEIAFPSAVIFIIICLASGPAFKTLNSTAAVSSG